MAASLEWHLTGGAANSDPDLSLGGTHSSVTISGTAMNNLFDNVSAAEATAGDNEYRALDLKNTGDATATGVEIYMSTETSSGDTSLDFWAEATADTTTSVANESTAPGGSSFSHYTTGSRLSTIDIPAGSYVRVWFKRIVSAAATNTANDSGTFTVEYA